MTTYATQLRDAALARLSTLPGWGQVEKTPVGTRQPDRLPYLGVYLIRDVWVPLSPILMGEPEFHGDATLGISVAVKAANGSALDAALDAQVERIHVKLLRDPSFISMLEGIVGVQRTRNYSGEGEAFFGEARIEMTLRYFEAWAPTIPDTLDAVEITTHVGGPNTPTLRTRVETD